MMDKLSKERSTAELFSQYAGVLWHWAWLLVLMALLAGGIAFYVSSNQTPIYQSSTLVIINGAPSTQTDAYSAIYISQQLAPTYAQVMTTGPVLEATAQRLGLSSFPGTAEVTPITNTQLMRVTVTDTDPTRAALLANTLVDVFAAQLQADQTSRYADSKGNLETQMAAIDKKVQDTTASIAILGQQIANATSTLAVTATTDLASRTQLQADLVRYQSEKAQLEVTRGQYQQSYYYLLQSYEQLKLAEAQSTASILQKDPALPVYSPIQPQPLRSALLAAAVGFMIAAGIIFLIEFLDDTLKTPEDVENRLGIPVLGYIAEIPRQDGRHSGIYVTRQPRSPVAEAFRSLRTNLEFAEVDHPLRTIMITSAGPSEGKSTIAVNLASVIAQGNRKVTLLDADLRKPSIHHFFQLPNRTGLTDLFRNRLDLGSVTNDSEDIPGLKVITSGSLPPNPADLLASARMERILAKIKEAADIVVIDTPPAMVPDAQVISSKADCVLLVIQPGKTHTDAAVATMEQLQRTGARVVGAVLNRINRHRGGYYGKYRYHANYYYNYEGKPAANEVKPAETNGIKIAMPDRVKHEESAETNGSKIVTPERLKREESIETDGIKMAIPDWLKHEESSDHSTASEDELKNTEPVEMTPEDVWPFRPLIPDNKKRDNGSK